MSGEQPPPAPTTPAAEGQPYVEIYARPLCGFCSQAKALLDHKGVAYTEYDIWAAPERLQDMKRRSGGQQTVPQIFIRGEHVGGCDALLALDRSGALDKMLRPCPEA